MVKAWIRLNTERLCQSLTHLYISFYSELNFFSLHLLVIDMLSGYLLVIDMLSGYLLVIEMLSGYLLVIDMLSGYLFSIYFQQVHHQEFKHSAGFI